MFCGNHSFFYLQHGYIFQPSEALLLIMLGKVLLNVFLLRVRRQTLRKSFMGYFCISLALLDLVLLVVMSFISHFQNFMLLGVRFTKYHICFLTQITAFTYGILHYPVFAVAGLDYCFTVTQTSKSPNICQKSLYIVTVILMWISVFCYVLTLPGSSIGLDVNHYNSAYQCPFYISSQTYWLSVGMLLIICLLFVISWSEVVNMVQSFKLIFFESEIVLFFPCVPECSPRHCAKHFLTKLLICFISSWAPFVFLQTLIVLLGAQIPAYIEMNVPWLYFINSFLIGIAYWVRRQHIELTEEIWDVDPFVSWKFCFTPLNLHCQNASETQKPVSEIIIC